MYTRLSKIQTKAYFRHILENALKQAEKNYRNYSNIQLNVSIYNQLIDIKETVVEGNHIYTKDEAYSKYSLGVQVARNYIGGEENTDYAKMLSDIAWGISLYPTMPEK